MTSPDGLGTATVDTLMTPALVELPAASDATASSVCAPSGTVAVFQLKSYGAVRSITVAAPSTNQTTFATPTSSDASAWSGTMPVSASAPAGGNAVMAGAAVSTIGAWRSNDVTTM